MSLVARKKTTKFGFSLMAVHEIFRVFSFYYFAYVCVNRMLSTINTVWGFYSFLIFPVPALFHMLLLICDACNKNRVGARFLYAIVCALSSLFLNEYRSIPNAYLLLRMIMHIRFWA